LQDCKNVENSGTVVKMKVLISAIDAEQFGFEVQSLAR
jgi:hypothetical protein